MHQNVPSVETQTGVQPYKAGVFDAYVSYCALGGIITEDDGGVHKMTLDEFCTTYDVNRHTLVRWKNQTPDWAERVERRRAEIMPLSRVTAVWNATYITAIQTKDKRSAVEAQKLFLGHFGKLQLPVQRQDVKVEHSLAAAFARADQVIEGELADGSPRSVTDAAEAELIPPTT